MNLAMQRDIIIWMQGFSNSFTDFFFNFISFFGEPEFYILLLGFIYWVINKKAGEFLGVTLGFSISLNNILKGIFNLDRPFITYADDIINMRGYSATGSAFPSGHVQGSTTVFYALAAYYKKRFLWIFASVMLVLMMVSRMFLGAHYLVDTVAGGVVGIVVATGAYRLYEKVHIDEQRLHKLYLIVLVALLPAVFLIDVNDFFRGYGIYAGIILAVMYEKKHVNFSYDISLAKKALRYVLGVASMMAVMILLGELFALLGFEDGSFGKNFLDLIRFFVIAFVGFGLYPKLYTKLNF